MKINKDMKIGDIYYNPFAMDLWILRKGYPNDCDNEEWVLSLVHTDYEEEYLAVKDFVKVGNIYDMVDQLQQKENIIKEAREYIENHNKVIRENKMLGVYGDFMIIPKELLEILDKERNNE